MAVRVALYLHGLAEAHLIRQAARHTQLHTKQHNQTTRTAW
jgi:hypothetical protein